MTNLAPYSIPLSIVYKPVEEGWVQARIAERPAVIMLSLRDTPPEPLPSQDREPVALEISG